MKIVLLVLAVTSAYALRFPKVHIKISIVVIFILVLLISSAPMIQVTFTQDESQFYANNNKAFIKLTTDNKLKIDTHFISVNYNSLFGCNSRELADLVELAEAVRPMLTAAALPAVFLIVVVWWWLNDSLQWTSPEDPLYSSVSMKRRSPWVLSLSLWYWVVCWSKYYKFIFMVAFCQLGFY